MTKKETKLQVQVFVDQYMPSDEDVKAYKDFVKNKNNQSVMRELAKQSPFSSINMYPF